MKLFKSFALAAAIIFVATTCFAAQTYQFKISSAMSSNFPPQKSLVEFVDYLNKNSKGRIVASKYSDGQLGGILETLEALQMGVVQMVMPVTSDLAGYSKKIQVLDLPFLFKDFNSMRKALDGPLGKEMDKIYESQGFKCFGYAPNGTRHISNSKRPIYTPKDLKGLKIRVMQNPMHISIFKALGANPTPLSFSELYTALQQKVVDGQENAPAQVVDSKLHEVQKYYSMTGHLQSMICLLVSKKWYDSLPQDLKKVFDEGIKQYEKTYVKRYFDYDDECLETMKKAGVKVNTLTEEQRQKFKDMCKPIYEDYKKVVGKDLMELAISSSK
jgi:tripartite ATP-independent transporter DctP family solute receptor